MSAAYERDFFAWASEQAALLRSGRLKEADIARIAEEIESMGKAEKLLAGDGQGSASRPGASSARQFEPQVEYRRGDERRLWRRHHPRRSETVPPGAALPSSCHWSFEQAMHAGFWPA